ncbi:hypothetical protein LQG66_29520 [Bradyrhizobium ontarionense]|uniref:Uncharacterized protein n=1 Tax=Bradyrhizobium ontarionense TaxID=2898149 RepID=A0ABY3R9B7_9BRAD|nr:hypothetical protein [Bradyrhizobium sp. A19]UFZ03333.1 hypothetical protein LQG66_29520 [Bradyrhizobium sp. A19]
MRIRSSFLVIAAAAWIPVGLARAADSDADKLREALRAATMQTRQLEDQRAALQAKLADAEKEKAVAKAQIEGAKAETRRVEKRERETTEEFNRRLAERDETLDKWKAAYEEAASVARDRDAARAKFEAEAKAYKASTDSCVAKNTQLITHGQDLLRRYQSVTIGDTIVAREPVLGLRRVEIQNAIQDLRDKILDQKAAP